MRGLRKIVFELKKEIFAGQTTEFDFGDYYDFNFGVWSVMPYRPEWTDDEKIKLFEAMHGTREDYALSIKVAADDRAVCHEYMRFAITEDERQQAKDLPSPEEIRANFFKKWQSEENFIANLRKEPLIEQEKIKEGEQVI